MYIASSGKFNKGLNAAGKIIMRVRDRELPKRIVIGDSMICDINVHGSDVVAIRGSNLHFVCTSAAFICGEYVDSLLGHIGTNDLVDRDHKAITHGSAVIMIFILFLYSGPTDTSPLRISQECF